MNTQTTQSNVAARIEKIIPAELMNKFNHLSFAEMAEREEFAEWKKELLQAESDWFNAVDA